MKKFYILTFIHSNKFYTLTL